MFQQMAELGLLPAARKYPGAIVVADGTSAATRSRTARTARPCMQRCCWRRSYRALAVVSGRITNRHNRTHGCTDDPIRPSRRRSRLAQAVAWLLRFLWRRPGRRRRRPHLEAHPGPRLGRDVHRGRHRRPGLRLRQLRGARNTWETQPVATSKTCSSCPWRAATAWQGADRVAAQRDARGRLGPPVLDDPRGQRARPQNSTTSSRRRTSSCAT